MAILTGPLMSAYVNWLLARAGSDDDAPLGLVDGEASVDGLTGAFDLRDDDGNVFEVVLRPREPAAPAPDPGPLDLAREHFRAILAIGDAQAEDPTRAHAMGLGQIGKNSAELAGFMAQVSIAEDLHRLADHLTGGPEKVTMDQGALICVPECGNDPTMSGFDPCLEDGTPVEPTVEGPWKGRLYVCLDCGRIIDQYTLVVTGRRGEPYIRALQDRITDLENQVERLTR